MLQRLVRRSPHEEVVASYRERAGGFCGLRANHCGMWIVLALVVIVSACRQQVPDRGIRPEFKGEKVSKVVMTPFYSSSLFGASEADREEVYERYEQYTSEFLTGLGFDVMGPREFSQHLVEKGAWQSYEDGWVFRNALENYFRASLDRSAAELVTLKALRESDALPEGVLLFGEVVYQSTLECRVFADEQVTYATVDHLKGIKVEAGNPCVVSHLYGVIVDPSSGQIMWSNRALLELHVDKISDAVVELNMQRVVELVFAGKQGAEALLAR